MVCFICGVHVFFNDMLASQDPYEVSRFRDEDLEELFCAFSYSSWMACIFQRVGIGYGEAATAHDRAYGDFRPEFGIMGPGVSG